MSGRTAAYRKAVAAAVACGISSGASPALAACPVELATYGEPESGARVEFTPVVESAAVTNSFRMLLGDDVVLDGIVMWTEGVSRSYGMLMYKCPSGDVTGEEIAACTVWEGVVYASDKAGKIGLLPAEGEPAPDLLLFADLGPSVAASPALQPLGLAKKPWDVFSLDGCQE
ncbi:hypothetical protein [Arvimicrobium flavum]|uniref:hypothetical protein n=1 Tax=Arvimicrobium flavum TaxID=3393320 RepID=UPI00237A5920|nr:hypothetical protein [Mesorhizobium shangrilense]